MLQRCTPESVGIPSAAVRRYIDLLESRGLSMHDVVLARGERIFAEAYWAPFVPGETHRMYSETKSYVGIAVCLLAREGRISLDDPIVSFFPDKLPETVHPYIAAQTVRHMLMMQTAVVPASYWFTSGTQDRVRHYFESRPNNYPGTGFRYDSEGSFVLAALVERVTGQKVLDYLRDRCLRRIGFSEKARILEAPGGYSWGDSALLCTPEDMLSFGILIGHDGMWQGEQVLPADLVREACAVHTAPHQEGMLDYSSHGYGYQIWHFAEDARAFNGMCDQVTLYHPGTDVTFTCNAGNIGADSRSVIMNAFYEIVLRAAGDPLPEDPEATAALTERLASLRLFATPGERTSPLAAEINGRTFRAVGDNRMHIRCFRLDFDGEGGTFRYENDQGEKALRFAFGDNVLQQFPQTGYSAGVGSFAAPGHTYRCAVSAGWRMPNDLKILVQIIDDYIGRLDINLGFNEGHAQVRMFKTAENFLDEYQGTMDAVMEEA